MILVHFREFLKLLLLFTCFGKWLLHNRGREGGKGGEEGRRRMHIGALLPTGVGVKVMLPSGYRIQRPEPFAPVCLWCLKFEWVTILSAHRILMAVPSPAGWSCPATCPNADMKVANGSSGTMPLTGEVRQVASDFLP